MRDSLTTNPIGESAWQSVLDAAPVATPFHCYKYLEFVTRLNKGEFVPLGLFQGRELVGLLPVVRFKKGPFKIAGTPVSFAGLPIPYLGPVVREPLLPAAFGALESWLEERRIDYAELSVAPTVELPELRGWETVQRMTILVDLVNDEQRLWRRLTKECRRHIKRAESSQVSVARVSDIGFFGEYLKMAADVYRKANRNPPLGINYFEGLWNLWNAKGQVRVLAALHNEKPIAAQLFLLDPVRKIAYALDGVSYASANPLCANNLIQWEFLRQLAREGYERYDMLGASIAGIRTFKLSFGGSLAGYTYAYRSRTIMAKVARKYYQQTAAALRSIRFRFHKS